MVRQYKRKPGRVDPAKRMARAAELRTEGLSLRQIAERLACGIGTVHRDLQRWEEAHPNVTPAPFQNTVPFSPRRGDFGTPDWNSADLNVISLADRRKGA